MSVRGSESVRLLEGQLVVRTGADEFLFAERAGRVVGRLALLVHGPSEAALDSPVVVPGESVPEVAGALLAAGVARARSLGVARIWVVLHTRLSYLQELLEAMPRLGYAERWRKNVYSLDPASLPDRLAGPELRYRPVDASDAEALDVVARVLAAPINWNDRRGDNRELLRETEEQCGEDGIHGWELAYDGARPVGFVLPGWVDAPARLAGNLYVGVAPDARGRGIGRALHHRGLLTMKREGAQRFVGSTDAANVSMRRIFEGLGYRDAGVQHYFEPVDG